MDQPEKHLTTRFHKLTTQQKIDSATQLTRDIKDPELGNIGEKFLQEVIDTGCTQVIDTSLKNCLASYCSFDFVKGFINRITYGKAAQESKGRLYSAQNHEATHAVQKKNSPALHASPFNPDTKFIICPRDWVTLEERCEEGAYAMQAVLNYLAVSALPTIKETAKWDPITVEEFEKIKAATPGKSLREAVVEAARHALDKSYFRNDPDAEYRFRNKVQDVALANYESAVNLRRGEKGLIFVRLDPEDIAKIGKTCGFNIFGDKEAGAEFTKPSTLSTKKPAVTKENKNPLSPQEKLEKLNKDCGIADADKLPTLSEALRDEFIRQSYEHAKPPVSGPKS